SASTLNLVRAFTQGGFAEYVAANKVLVFSVPENFSLEQAVCLPEAAFTVWISLVWQAKLQPNETILIHGGTSGVGNIAIQMAKFLGAKIITTAGSNEKCVACLKIGADNVINYKSEDFVKKAPKIDVILDMVGGDYFEKNLSILNQNGRLCIIAFLQGAKINANIAPILLKHLSIFGSTLRSRSIAEKAKIADELFPFLNNMIENHAVNPLIDKIFPLREAEKGLHQMEEGLNIGKILIKM
ncbi:MAG: zinc-binding dehydrogenase, partial [Pseudomonadota bacterium]